MTVVAVAGGTGDLGRTIVEAIAKTGKHTVYVLSRNADPTHPIAAVAKLVALDYDSPSKISDVLQQLHIETVISTLNLNWPGSPQSQLNLIQGSAQSGVVKRFIPSEFNIDYNVSEDRMPYPPRVDQLKAIEELQQHPQLTYTLIRNGNFLDYLGLPFAETYLKPLYMVLDLQAAEAAIPGDGTSTVAFTHTTDVGKLVAALLDVPAAQWPLESTVIGEKIVLNDLISLAEQVTGQQFRKTFDSLERLRKMQTTELPSNRPSYPYFPGGKAELDMIVSTMMVGMATGVFDVSGTNLQTFAPDIETMKIEPFLRSCWAKGQRQATA
ncbi:hypothetical protein RBB50_006786 [Rhinocladiella similis]